MNSTFTNIDTLAQETIQKDILKRFPLISAFEETKSRQSPMPPPLIRIDQASKPYLEENATKMPTNNSLKFSIDNLLSGGKNSKVSAGNKIEMKQNHRDGVKKPNHRNLPSYTSMIGQVILSHGDKRLTLCEIYEYIQMKFPDIEERVKGWRNCVRHNLSLNECFIKVGLSLQGRGNYWTVHPSYVDSFLRGQFRKRTKRVSPRRRMLNFTNSPPYLNMPGVFQSPLPCPENPYPPADFHLGVKSKDIFARSYDFSKNSSAFSSFTELGQPALPKMCDPACRHTKVHHQDNTLHSPGDSKFLNNNFRNFYVNPGFFSMTENYAGACIRGKVGALNLSLSNPFIKKELAVAHTEDFLNNLKVKS